MALSDYLTSEEWDAIFYMMADPNVEEKAQNFGHAMRIQIERLQEAGHVFPGLDAEGNKVKQIASDNPEKIFAMLNEDAGKLVDCYAEGRKYLKEHYPGLVFDTDETYEQEIKEAREELQENGKFSD